MTAEDLTGELDTCLDVLGEYFDWLTRFDSNGDMSVTPVDRPDGVELRTAVWQTIELASTLLDEHFRAWEAVRALRLLLVELQEQLAKRDMWTPRVVLPKHPT